MSIIGKHMEDITTADIVNLLTNKVTEQKHIEYKQILPGQDDKSRIRYIASVTSFANTDGGYLIYGIEAKDAIPTAIPGLTKDSADKDILRLDEMVRDGVRPRIHGIEYRQVTMADGSIVLVVHIPKSWNLPHQITSQKEFRFYGRASIGKYMLDVDDLRSLFMVTETAGVTIRKFRSERALAIERREEGVQLKAGACIVLHAFPLSALRPGYQIDLKKVYRAPDQLAILGRGSPRYNLDGLITRDEWLPHCSSYCQLYRNGVVEAVLLMEEYEKQGVSMLASTYFEQEVMKNIS